MYNIDMKKQRERTCEEFICKTETKNHVFYYLIMFFIVLLS